MQQMLHERNQTKDVEPISCDKWSTLQQTKQLLAYLRTSSLKPFKE